MTVEGLGGRRKSVDMKDKAIKKQVEIFGRLCATQQEMADFFDCNLSTIEKYMAVKVEDGVDKLSPFLRCYKKAQANSKTSLRRVQMNKALNGDNTLLIWLGKQLLEQTDKIEQNRLSQNINTNLNKEVAPDTDLDKEVLDRYFQTKGKPKKDAE